MASTVFGVAAIARAGAARGHELLRVGVPARIRRVGAAGGTEQSQLLPGAADRRVATAGVGVAAVEAVRPLAPAPSHCRAACSPALRRQLLPVDRGRQLPGDDGHRVCSWPATTDSTPMNIGLLLSAERYSVTGYWNSWIDCQRHMTWLGARARHRALGLHAADCCSASVVCGPAASCRRREHERIGGRRERRVFGQRAVAVAVAAVAGLHEPVETPGRVGLVGRLLHQLLHRDRAVGAGGVIVEVAGDVRAFAAGRSPSPLAACAALIAAALSARGDGERDLLAS